MIFFLWNWHSPSETNTHRKPGNKSWQKILLRFRIEKLVSCSFKFPVSTQAVGNSSTRKNQNALGPVPQQPVSPKFPNNVGLVELWRGSVLDHAGWTVGCFLSRPLQILSGDQCCNALVSPFAFTWVSKILKQSTVIFACLGYKRDWGDICQSLTVLPGWDWYLWPQWCTSSQRRKEDLRNRWRRNCQRDY